MANSGFGLSLPTELKGLGRIKGQSNYCFHCHCRAAKTINGLKQKYSKTASDSCGCVLVSLAAAPLQKHTSTDRGYGRRPVRLQKPLYFSNYVY